MAVRGIRSTTGSAASPPPRPSGAGSSIGATWSSTSCRLPPSSHRPSPSSVSPRQRPMPLGTPSTATTSRPASRSQQRYLASPSARSRRASRPERRPRRPRPQQTTSPRQPMRFGPRRARSSFHMQSQAPRRSRKRRSSSKLETEAQSFLAAKFPGAIREKFPFAPSRPLPALYRRIVGAIHLPGSKRPSKQDGVRNQVQGAEEIQKDLHFYEIRRLISRAWCGAFPPRCRREGRSQRRTSSGSPERGNSVRPSSGMRVARPYANRKVDTGASWRNESRVGSYYPRDASDLTTAVSRRVTDPVC